MPRWVVAPYEQTEHNGRWRRRSVLVGLLPAQDSDGPEPWRGIEIAGDHCLAFVEDEHLAALAGQGGITILPDIQPGDTLGSLSVAERRELRDVANTLRGAIAAGDITVTAGMRFSDLLEALREGRREPHVGQDGRIAVDGPVRACNPLPPLVAGGDDRGRLDAWLWRRELDALLAAGASRRTLIDHGVVFAGGAFPTTSVLETFTGSNGTSPPNANWTNNGEFAGGTVQIQSNMSTGTVPGGNSAYWDTSTFGPNSEAGVTVVTAAGDYVGLDMRMQTPATSGVDLYAIYWNLGVANEIEVYECTNASFVQNGASINNDVVSGDSVGMEMIGSTITAYRKQGAGAWASPGTRTDGTITAAGFIGLGHDGTAVRCDNFFGGTVGAAAAVSDAWRPARAARTLLVR